MAISAQQIINRAYRLAIGVGADATVSPVLDNLWAFEEAFPLAYRRAFVEIGHSSSEIEEYRHQHTLSVTDGSATLPDGVLTEFLDSSTLYSGDDPTIAELSSYAPRWSSFQRPVHDQLHYYTHKEDKLFFRPAGGNLFEWDGELELVCITMPELPASITGEISFVSPAMADRVVEILAGMIVARPSA